MLKMVQYGVHDLAYPRNARVRAELRARAGIDSVVVERTRGGSSIGRAFHDVAALWRASRHADVVMLAEMRVTHAPLIWAVGRLRRSVVVIDRFIGLHETAVEDWGTVRRGSLRARRFAVQDRVAERLGDIVVTDTAVRAGALRTRSGREALDLPVGAPAWARWSPPAAPSDVLRILYYGNYIPLHGTELVVDALAGLRGRRAFEAVFVGNGVRRAAMEARAAAVGIADRVTFRDAVPESALAGLIADADVVLGVFGDSAKARTVVANKVWQGLASGRVVVTQRSAAATELLEAAGELLVLTEPGSSGAIAEALAVVDVVQDEAGAQGVADRLEQFVGDRYARFVARIAVELERVRA